MTTRTRDEGLKGQTARGAMFMTVAMALFRIAHLVSLIWLARILSPDDFGRVSLVVATLAILGPFAGLGINQAIIHTREDVDKAAFSGLVVVLCTGSVFALSVSLGSDLIAGVLGNADIGLLLRWMAVSLALDSIGMVPTALLEKRLMFGRVGALSLSADLSYVAAAMILAYGGYGVWSLALAHILRSGVKAGLSWILVPSYSWVRRHVWDVALVKRLLRYGTQTVASSAVALINSTWDNLYVGASLGTRALGFYGKSYDFMNLIKSVNDMANRVLFPSYTLIRGDEPRLRSAYVRTVEVISLITMPAALGLMVVAPELVPTMLGDEWLPMVPVLEVLAFMGLVRPLSGTTAPLFLAVGRPSYNIWVSLVHTVIMIPLGVFMVRSGYGIVGVAGAVAFAYAVGWAFNVYQVQKFMPGSAGDILRAMRSPTFASVVMAATVYVVKAPARRALADVGDVALLLVLIGTGAVTYTVVLLLVDRRLVWEAIDLARTTLRRRPRAPSGEQQE